jgi:DNA-nicking Smr family endonuclease
MEAAHDSNRELAGMDAMDDGTGDDVVVPIEDAIDLHAFAPKDVRDVVGSYLTAAWEAGLREVRLIHGRGIGVQRESVRAVLARHPLVMSFADAPPERGGWGATVVFLKSAPPLI